MPSRNPRFIWLFIVLLSLIVSAAVWVSVQPENKPSPLPVREQSNNKSSQHEPVIAGDDAQKKEQLDALEALVKAGDIRHGHSLVHACNDCHTFDEDGPHRFGPNLFGIYGAHFASKPDYKYSEALIAMKDKAWDAENLNNFFINTKGFIPGTKMNYPGVPKAEDRADIIAYLKTLK